MIEQIIQYINPLHKDKFNQKVRDHLNDIKFANPKAVVPKENEEVPEPLNL